MSPPASDLARQDDGQKATAGHNKAAIARCGLCGVQALQYALDGILRQTEADFALSRDFL